MLDPTLQLLALVGDDFTRLCFERCCLDARRASGCLDPLIHPSNVTTVGSCLDLGAQGLPVLVGTAAGGLLGLALSCSQSVACAVARVMLVSQEGYPFGFRDWLHFFPVRLEPVSILVCFSSERRHGRVVNSIPEVTPFGIRDIGCRLVGKFFLKGLDEALSLGWVGSSAGVDAGATLCLGVVDLTRLQPDLAANKGVICVTVCAVIASRVEDAAEVSSPGNDKVKLVPVA